MNINLQVLLAVVVIAIPSFTSHGQLDRLLTPLGTEAIVTRQDPPRGVNVRQQAPAYTLNAEAFVTELEKELSARLSLNGELKLTLAQPWKALKLPADHFAIEIGETPANGLAGTFVVRAKITSGGELVAEAQYSLRAQLWQEVWTAASRLDRGQPLDRSLLTTTKVDVLRERQPPLLAEIDPTTLDLVQTVSASRPLTRRDVTERPLVKRGQVVEVVAHSGQLVISMKALALQSGASGELIKLRNLESRKEFTGQILNENKVQVHF